jgi:hypothetical protein
MHSPGFWSVQVVACCTGPVNSALTCSEQELFRSLRVVYGPKPRCLLQDPSQEMYRRFLQAGKAASLLQTGKQSCKQTGCMLAGQLLCNTHVYPQQKLACSGLSV